MQACTLGDQCDYEELAQVGTTSYWSWCACCERAYPTRCHRHEGGQWLCPYEGCVGNTTTDRWQWRRVRTFHPEYPAIPEVGVHYILYS